MSDGFWLTEAQVERLRPFGPEARGRARVEDRQGLSGILRVQRNGLMGKDAPAVHRRPKTLYDRWKRWSRTGGLRPHPVGAGRCEPGR